MEKVEYQVPLNKLYVIQAACRNTVDDKFCGILLHIIDEKTKAANQGMPYLLQIWRHGGVLIFEKPLSKPLYSWNMAQEKFLFQVDSEVAEVYLILLHECKQPEIYKFVLPNQRMKKYKKLTRGAKGQNSSTIEPNINHSADNSIQEKQDQEIKDDLTPS